MNFTKTLFAMSLLMTSVARAEVTVENPYVRAMPPGQTVTGAFMLLQNSSPDDRSVVSATSPVAGIVELHTHVNENGMMKMRQIPKIDVGAGASTELKPGGLHVMLINVAEQLKVGDSVEITLKMDDGSETVIHAPVKTVTGGMMQKGKGGMQGMHGMHGGGGSGPANAVQSALKRANPMPNYMQAVVKRSDMLNLTGDQQAKLQEWRDQNSKAVAKLAMDIVASEDKLQALSLAGADAAEIEAAAEASLSLRKEMITRKTRCRDNLKSVLDEKQYAKVVELYQGMMN